ncbi:MAG: hypothetical protein HXK89_00405 [Lachnospiraceae bacterium]|nr:hypothetical protein [Lachnospiraceae bacterium]
MLTNVDITLFNAVVDKETRQEKYYSTLIRGVSYYESEAISANDGIWTDKSVYRFRIPTIGAEIEGNRTYIPEKKYNAWNAPMYFTLQKGDLILIAEASDQEPLTRADIERIAKWQSCRVITVTEYADNTIRGSDAIKHLRIGGA